MDMTRAPRHFLRRPPAFGSDDESGGGRRAVAEAGHPVRPLDGARLDQDEQRRRQVRQRRGAVEGDWRCDGRDNGAATLLRRGDGDTVPAFAARAPGEGRERHLAAEDAPLFAFIEKVRAKLPATPVRIFVVADAPYFRGRGAYHLYPHNVLFDPFRNSLPNPATLHAGDYVLVYQRRGLQYNAEEKKLKLDQGSPIPAEAVLVEPGAALLKVL